MSPSRGTRGATFASTARRQAQRRRVEHVELAYAKHLPASETLALFDAQADATGGVHLVEPLPFAQRPAADAAPAFNDEAECCACVDEQFGRVSLLARPKLRGGAARRERVVPAAPGIAERHQQNERRLGGRTLARHRQHSKSVCVATGSSAIADGVRLYGLRPH